MNAVRLIDYVVGELFFYHENDNVSRYDAKRFSSASTPADKVRISAISFSVSVVSGIIVITADLSVAAGTTWPTIGGLCDIAVIGH